MLNLPRISWHEKQPVFSVDFQPNQTDNNNDGWLRLASCGNNACVNIWRIEESSQEISLLAELNRHIKTVNCVRWSPTGKYLASGGDDGCIFIWTLSQAPVVATFGEEKDIENKENWIPAYTFRGGITDVYDLSWKKNGEQLISVGTDATTIVWEFPSGKTQIFKDHSHYIQGVSFDPKGEYFATQSSDRSVKIYKKKKNNNSYALKHALIRREVLKENNNKENENNNNQQQHNQQKNNQQNNNQQNNQQQNNQQQNNNQQTPIKKKTSQTRLFADETIQSFFRRLNWSPDGNFLMVPSGIYQNESSNDLNYTTFLFSRNSLSKPILHLPSPDAPTIVTRFCPTLFYYDPKIHSTPPLFQHHSKEEILKIKNQKQNQILEEKKDEKNNLNSSSSSSLKTKKKNEVFEIYKMIFAIATTKGLYIYDTSCHHPIAIYEGIHYAVITDLTWSENGHLLLVSSKDGFCSLIVFEKGQWGEAVLKEEGEVEGRKKEE